MKGKLNKDTIFNIGLTLALLIVLLIVQICVPNSSTLINILKKTAIYALAAVSMNLLNGFTGLFSLGQAGFMVLGAYAYTIFTIPPEQQAAVFYKTGGGLIQVCLPAVAALVIAGVVAAIFAYLIGLPVLRLKSDYLAIATLGFAEIVRTIIQSTDLQKLTNGPDPLCNYTTFSGLMPYVAVSAVCILLIVLVLNSSYGRAFKAIRDDEIAAEAMGINLAHHKRLSFVISSFFAGVAGAMLAMYNSTLSATTFNSAMTYEILLIVVIGGIGSISGSILASFLFIASSEWWLRFLDYESYIGAFKVPLLRGGFRKVVFSVAIMIIVLFFRRGIMGDKEFSISALTRRFRRKKVAGSEGGAGNG